MQLDWVEELKVRFVSGENVIFLLHGNVNDLFPFFMTKKKTSMYFALDRVPVSYAQGDQRSHRGFQS